MLRRETCSFRIPFLVHTTPPLSFLPLPLLNCTPRAVGLAILAWCHGILFPEEAHRRLERSEPMIFSVHISNLLGESPR